MEKSEGKISSRKSLTILFYCNRMNKRYSTAVEQKNNREAPSSLPDLYTASAVYVRKMHR